MSPAMRSTCGLHACIGLPALGVADHRVKLTPLRGAAASVGRGAGAPRERDRVILNTSELSYPYELLWLMPYRDLSCR